MKTSKAACLKLNSSGTFAAIGEIDVPAAACFVFHCRLVASKWGLVRSRSVTRAAAAGTFPCQLCTASVTNACQDLVTTGSRLFGLSGFGSALKVRIYDFAVYIHPEQVSDLMHFWHEKCHWNIQPAVQYIIHCCA